jgi:lipoprotein-anchoring transpeptidase ErfK/SrfK
MMMTTMAVLLCAGLAQATPAPKGTTGKDPVRHEALGIQVALDRAGFSPGVLDGAMGSNTKKALEAYRTANGNEPAATEPLMAYRITEEDAAGPFEKNIPDDLVEQAKLKSLGYRSLLEMLAERFHATPALLQELNPGAKFAPGEEIQVPNVEPMVVPVKPSADKKAPGNEQAKEPADKKPGADQPEVTVTVTKSTSALAVTDASGKVLMYAPVTTGSEKDPLPIGDWKVNGVGLQPEFRYNPDLFWDADPAHTKALIPSGPNNPVGLVWIDISKEHYGLHGTPEPASIGRSESHGCVRLTNWDALRLASLVKAGTPVLFRE